jgi:hypothetical protein
VTRVTRVTQFPLPHVNLSVTNLYIAAESASRGSHGSRESPITQTRQYPGKQCFHRSAPPRAAVRTAALALRDTPMTRHACIAPARPGNHGRATMVVMVRIFRIAAAAVWRAGHQPGLHRTRATQSSASGGRKIQRGGRTFRHIPPKTCLYRSQNARSRTAPQALPQIACPFSRRVDRNSPI